MRIDASAIELIGDFGTSRPMMDTEMDRLRSKSEAAVVPDAAWGTAGPWFSAAGLVVAGLAAALLSVPTGTAQVAAVFPPWWPHARVFAAAAGAGEVAGTGLMRSILIVGSDRPGLTERLHAAGALLVLAADGPFGCRSTSSREIAR